MSDAAFPAALASAAADARSIGAALELAVHANDGSGPALEALAGGLASIDVAVARVLVYFLREGFSATQGCTPASVVALVRRHLGAVAGTVPFAGGTNQSFGDVNRDRPTDPVFGGLCFSISPTVHAADDASIVENLVGQSEVVRMARSIAGGMPIAVSPVTIATRFGPYPAGPSAPGDLPAAVDVRQASLLGAAWTVGSLKHLAEAGADSVTYYETTGWRGVIERDDGSDARFPSRAGDVFPLFHPFADVAEWRDGTVLGAPSSRPLDAEALVVDDAAGRHVLAANLTRAHEVVVITGLPGTTVRVRMLDTDSFREATATPEAFRASRTSVPVEDGRLELALGPFAVARLDCFT